MSRLPRRSLHSLLAMTVLFYPLITCHRKYRFIIQLIFFSFFNRFYGLIWENNGRLIIEILTIVVFIPFLVILRIDIDCSFFNKLIGFSRFVFKIHITGIVIYSFGTGHILTGYFH